MPHSIVYVKGNYFRAGGAETWLGSVLPRVDRSRFAPTLVVLQKRGGPESPALTNGNLGTVRREIAWNGIAMAPRAAWLLGQVVRERNADLIHTHDIRSNLTAFLLTRRRRIPWIVQVHGWLGSVQSGRWRAYEEMDKRLVRRADLVLVGAAATKHEVERAGSPHVRVVPNSVQIPSVDSFNVEAERIRAELGATPATTVIGVVGRLHPGKGQAFLLHAIRRLRDKGHVVRGLLVGEGPDLERLLALTRSLDLAGVVSFVGFSSEPRPYIAAMDIFAFPSLRESMPLTVLEAMALRRPVVASRVGGLPEVITHGDSGVFVPPGDVSSLSEALETLVTNLALRRWIGERGRGVVVSRFSVETMTRRLEDVYSGILTEGRRCA